MKTKCKNCGGKNESKGIFCCARCKWTWHNNNRTLTPNVDYKCIVCGKRVRKWIAPSRIAAGVDTLEYCSRTCAGVGRTGSKHHQWKGGIRVDQDGYILIYSPNHPAKDARGCVRKHRLVMEDHIGRYLTATEVVHHIDDDPSNNCIENLKLYDSNTEHKRDDNHGRQRDENGRYLPKRVAQR